MNATEEWLVNYTANKQTLRDEEQEMIDSSISDCLARERQKETMPKLLKEIRE